MSVFCTNCGKDIPEQSQFCPMCGTVSRHTISAAVAMQEIKTGPFCPSCGRRTVEGSGFCIWCGRELYVRPSKGTSMWCSGCGGKVPIDSKFCSACGHDLVKWFKERADKKKILGGRYRLDEEIGSGSMGVVYRAFDLKLEMEVAIKTVPPELAKNKNTVLLLRKEAQTALKITHPNIIRLYSFEDDGQEAYLVMEYVHGETLENIVREQDKLSEERALLIGLEILKGLEEAHSNKVIHRDLKPGNIIIQTDGRIKILDFGIAKKIKETMTRFSSTVGPSSGTLLYMAPEQLRGRHESQQTDIYSFGVVMYELLSGNPPFYTGEITYQIINEQPPMLEGVSAEMNTILMKCMAKEPSKRYGSVAELVKGMKMVLVNCGQDKKGSVRIEELQKLEIEKTTSSSGKHEFIRNEFNPEKNNKKRSQDRDGRFIISEKISGEKVVTDTKTNLMWQGLVAEDKTWREAKDYSESLNYGGYEDWRLPTIAELETLINKSRENPASDFPDMPSRRFWSSLSYVYEINKNAWYANFNSGNISSYLKISKCDVRCVRGSLGRGF